MKKTWAVMGTAVAVSAMIFTGCGSSNTTKTDSYLRRPEQKEKSRT